MVSTTKTKAENENSSFSVNTYLVEVDYSLSVEKAVKHGNYDWVNPSINSVNFPTKQEGKREVAVSLAHFGRYISTEKAMEEIDKQGYRLAETHELLALGEKHLDLQREFPITALGSVWRNPRGGRYVPYLSGDGSWRSLRLFWLGIVWDEDWRFAVVRKTAL